MRTSKSSFRTLARRCLVILLLLLLSALACLAQSPGPDGEVGLNYEATLIALAGVPPYTWQILTGTLPPGLSLGTNTGVISGIPTSEGTYAFEVQWTDSTGSLGFPTIHTITIYPRLIITTMSPLPSGTIGVNYSTSIGVSGGRQPYFMSISPDLLPPGLTFSSAARSISGIPSEPGVFEFAATVTDDLGAVANRTFSLTTAPKLAIATESVPDAVAGEPYSFSFVAEGGIPPYTWSLIESSLPTGFMLQVTGRLSGTSSAVGSFPFTLRATDEDGNRDERTFSLTINPPLPTVSIDTDSPLSDGTVGVSYAFVLQASGGAEPYSWSRIEGSLPPGLTLSGDGTVSGEPTEAGEFTFQIRVTDGEEVPAEKVFRLTINPAPLVIETTSPLPEAIFGDEYIANLVASGGSPPYTWNASEEALPPGVTVDSAGRVSGVPTAAGQFGFTVAVTDSAATVVRRDFSLIVNPPATPAVSITGLADQAPPTQQQAFGVSLESDYPLLLTGLVTLVFTPEPGVDVDDPAIQFSTGGREVEFTIPEGETDAVFPVEGIALQTGTVAGTIVLTVQLSNGDQDVTPSPPPTQEIQVARSAPVITSVQTVRTGSGFEVRVAGFSTPREMTQAIFRFTPSAQANLGTTSAEISVSEAFATWYQREDSGQYGSAFEYTQPFSIQGDANAVSSLSVTLRNAQGDSQSVNSNF